MGAPWNVILAAIQGGVNAVAEGVGASEKAKRESQYLQQMITDVEKSGKSRIDAINTAFSNASSEMQNAMEKQVNVAVDEIQSSFNQAYQSLENQQKDAGDYFTEAGKKRREAFAKSRESMEASLQDSRQLLTNSFQQARMGQSGAFSDAIMKSQKMQLEKQKEMDSDQLTYEDEISKSFTKALGDISQAKQNLTTEEGKRLANTRISAGANVSSMIAGMMQNQIGMTDQIQSTMDDRLISLKDSKSRADSASQYNLGNAFIDSVIGSGNAGVAELSKMTSFGQGGDTGKQVPTTLNSLTPQNAAPDGKSATYKNMFDNEQNA